MFISQFFLFSFVLRKCQLRSYLSQQEGTVSVNTAPQLLCKQSTRGWGGLLEVGKERIYKRVSGLSSDVLVSDLWSHQIELDFWAAICVGTGWPNWPIDKLWRETSSLASLSLILNFWILDWPIDKLSRETSSSASLSPILDFRKLQIGKSNKAMKALFWKWIWTGHSKTAPPTNVVEL